MRLPYRLDPVVWRGAWWALRAVRATRRAAATGIPGPADLPPVRAPGPRGAPGVAGVLRLPGLSCLVRATVRQAWLAAQGERRDLVLGVMGAGRDFRAHAWLDGDPPADHEGYRELARRGV